VGMEWDLQPVERKPNSPALSSGQLRRRTTTSASSSSSLRINFGAALQLVAALPQQRRVLGSISS
jgi:hypothetical protein